MNLFVITYIAALLAIVLAMGAAIVLFLQRKKLLVWALSGYLLATAVWLGGNVLADISYTEHALWFTSGVAFIGGTMSTFSFLVLIDVLLDRKFSSYIRSAVYGIPLVVLSCFAFSQYAILDFTFPINAPAQITPGIIYAFAFYILLASLMYGTVRLIKHLRQENEYARKVQVMYVMVGLIVTLIGETLFVVILPIFGEERFYSLGPLSSIFFAICCTYAILRHNLLDIRIIVQRGVIYSLLVGLLVIGYAGALLILQTLIESRDAFVAQLSAMLIMVIGVFTVPKLESMLRKKTDHIFFKGTYEYSEAIQELTNILNKHNIPKPMIEGVKELLKRIFRVEVIDFVRKGQVVPSGYACDLPIVSQHKKLGNLLLGQKKSGDPYTGEDMHLLKTFATGFAVALAKAEFYEQSKRHSEELEEKVVERTKHLEELQVIQNRMIGDISHALQTPLTVLKGTLQRITESPTEVHNYVKVIDRSITNVSSFIHDLLRLSRLDALQEATFQTVDMSDLVRRIVEYVETICEVNKITLISHIEDDVYTQGNEKDLEELITVLLSNAVKYTKNASIKKITVTLTNTDDRVSLIVADTGIGIPHEKIGHIFERFYRAHEGGKEQGSGLGLAIAKRIAERHKGSIIVTSTEGEGSSFQAEFPRDTQNTRKTA